jgi:hypothetical protein
MIQDASLGRLGTLAIVLLVLAGCAPNAGSGTPQHTGTAPTVPSPAGDDARFLITCYFPGGGEVGVFTRLEEAWASTNYVRIDRCKAEASGTLELTAEEAAVAAVAARDLPDEDPAELFLRTLAACVRVVPGTTSEMPPPSVLEAALEWCPEAPHAELMQHDLDERE